MHYLYSKNDVFIYEVTDEYLNTGFYGVSGVERALLKRL
jgi:hypothetical protein